MTIKIWQSYSCNNSSSYRLVARFSDATTAQAAAGDLGAFFKAHAVEMDAIVEANDYTWPDSWPPGAVKFASKYGISLGRDVLGWGDEGLTGDEPELVVEDNVLLVYHSYSGGFGKVVPAYLSARGATKVEREDTGSPTLALLFSYAGGNRKLDAELKKLGAQIDNERSPLRQVDELETPWKSRSRYGAAAFYRDAKTVGMVVPFVPSDLADLRGWLTKHNLDAPSIRLCEPADATELAACAGATCEACGGVLELWHPQLRDVETAQMACGSCGGMYEMSTMVAAANKRARARERAERKVAAQAAAAPKKPTKPTKKPTKPTKIKKPTKVTKKTKPTKR